MEITIDQIKSLRARTGAGVNNVREALEFAAGDEEKAIEYLREKGLAKANKRADKQATNGIIGVYLHTDSRVAVLVEVASETDFAAKSPEMKQFANDIALHIAAVGSEYVSEEDVPQDIIEAERQAAQADVEGKPAEIAEKIIAGKLDKIYAEKVLMRQNFFLDESKTIADYQNELVVKVGEKIVITKFVKMQIAGPGISCGL